MPQSNDPGPASRNPTAGQERPFSVILSGMGWSPSRGAGDAAMCAVLAKNWWAVGLRGVFAILFALIAFSAPGSAILSLVLLFSAYMLVDGVAGIVSAVRAAKRDERWGLLLL